MNNRPNSESHNAAPGRPQREPLRAETDPAMPSAQAKAQAELLSRDAKNAEELHDTETLLGALIEECRRLVREVAVPSMAAMTDPLERMRFMQSAVSFIEAGAKVGDTVARLRSVGGQGEPRRRVVVERVPPALAPLHDVKYTVFDDDEV